jgi:hypothetical protein
MTLFFLLNFLGKNFQYKVDRSGESGYPTLLLRRKVLNWFSSLSMMLAVGLLRCISSISNLLRLHVERMLDVFSTSIEMII